MKPTLRAAALLLASLPAVAAGQPAVWHASGQGVAWHAASPPAPALSATASLLGRVGTDAAVRLMRSPDADERLRGIERAASIHTGSALLLLERAARTNGPGGFDPRLPESGFARRDPRALLAVVRGLAGWVTDPTHKVDDGARAALIDIVRAPNEAFAIRTTPDGAGGVADDARALGRVLRAREEAAIALATSGDPTALEQLVAAARAGGAGESPAIVALAVRPPADPVTLGAPALTTPAMIRLAARIGDLRTLDAILAVTRASDPALRAAAFGALGEAGDTRAVEPARAAQKDADASVRVAAAGALAHLGAPEASAAIADLVQSDETALEGLRIARSVQDEAVTKAAAARAAESADAAIRDAAVAALGRQTSAGAIQALASVAEIPSMRAGALSAIARSPSPAAMAAIESLARGSAESRRLAARAYFVRRFTRGEASAALDALLRDLRASPDPRDRAVATQAMVALGQAVGGDAGAASALGADVSLADLRERAKGGGPEAPFAARALARASDEDAAPLLAVQDPVVRAQAALGLEENRAPTAGPRIAEAYRWEPDATVRRAMARAMAGRGGPREVLELAASLDPDAVVRWVANGALERPDGASEAATGAATGAATRPAHAAGGLREIAWLSLVSAEGSPSSLDTSAVLVDESGEVRRVTFDDEGYALVPGVSPGTLRVELAPELPAYTPLPAPPSAPRALPSDPR